MSDLIEVEYPEEAIIARQVAHEERTAKILSETGGEIIHPDEHNFREAFREYVLKAMDDCSFDNEFPKVQDKDLPDLFIALDDLAEKLFLRRAGYNV